MTSATPVPPPSRKQTRSQRTPSSEVVGDIVRAASELLEESGPDALTIRAIAERAGVSPASVYNHFDGKNGVLDALFRQGFDDLGASFRTADRFDAATAFPDAGRRYRQLALAKPHTYGLMFEHSVAGFEPSETSKLHAAAAFFELVDLVAWGIGAPGRTDEAVDIAQRMWSTAHGAVSLELRGLGFVEDREGLFDRLMETLERGLGHRSSD